MSKIEHKIAIPFKPGTIYERMDLVINEKRKTREASEAIRKWLTLGFLVGEMGDGILELFLTLEECGQLKGNTPKENALALVNMIQSRLTDTPRPPANLAEAPAVNSGGMVFGEVPPSQVVPDY